MIIKANKIRMDNGRRKIWIVYIKQCLYISFKRSKKEGKGVKKQMREVTQDPQMDYWLLAGIHEVVQHLHWRLE